MARERADVTEVKSDGMGFTGALTAAPTDGIEIPNGRGDVMLYVSNADAAPINVTLITPEERADVVPVEDPVTAIAAGGDHLFGYLLPSTFNSGGLVNVNFSAVANVSYLCFRNGK